VARKGDLIPRRYDPGIAAEGPAPLTFDDIARLVVDLAGRLRGEHDLMLVITRGGLIPGGILAYLAGYKNIVVAAVEFYDDDGRRGPEPAFHQFPSAELLRDRTVLIVDEVWDSGRTIEAVTRRVREAGGIPTTAVLHYKPGRSEVDAVPDHYVVETDGWVTYPWTKVLAYLAVRPGP
jgi:hypoxanthine phosphoribosyltransferase